MEFIFDSFCNDCIHQANGSIIDWFATILFVQKSFSSNENAGMVSDTCCGGNGIVHQKAQAITVFVLVVVLVLVLASVVVTFVGSI